MGTLSALKILMSLQKFADRFDKFKDPEMQIGDFKIGNDVWFGVLLREKPQKEEKKNGETNIASKGQSNTE